MAAAKAIGNGENERKSAYRHARRWLRVAAPRYYLPHMALAYIAFLPARTAITVNMLRTTPAHSSLQLLPHTAALPHTATTTPLPLAGWAVRTAAGLLFYTLPRTRYAYQHNTTPLPVPHLPGVPHLLPPCRICVSLPRYNARLPAHNTCCAATAPPYICCALLHAWRCVLPLAAAPVDGLADGMVLDGSGCQTGGWISSVGGWLDMDRLDVTRISAWFCFYSTFGAVWWQARRAAPLAAPGCSAALGVQDKFSACG